MGLLFCFCFCLCFTSRLITNLVRILLLGVGIAWALETGNHLVLIVPLGVQEGGGFLGGGQNHAGGADGGHASALLSGRLAALSRSLAILAALAGSLTTLSRSLAILSRSITGSLTTLSRSITGSLTTLSRSLAILSGSTAHSVLADKVREFVEGRVQGRNVGRLVHVLRKGLAELAGKGSRATRLPLPSASVKRLSHGRKLLTLVQGGGSPQGG